MNLGNEVVLYRSPKDIAISPSRRNLTPIDQVNPFVVAVKLHKEFLVVQGRYNFYEGKQKYSDLWYSPSRRLATDQEVRRSEYYVAAGIKVPTLSDEPLVDWDQSFPNEGRGYESLGDRRIDPVTTFREFQLILKKGILPHEDFKDSMYAARMLIRGIDQVSWVNGPYPTDYWNEMLNEMREAAGGSQGIAEIRKAVPPLDELEKVILNLRQNGFGVNVKTLRSEMKAGILQPSPSLAVIIEEVTPPYLKVLSHFGLAA